MMPTKRYRLDANGQLYDEDGNIWNDDRIDADHIEVPHLVPHVVTFDIGTNKKNDSAKVLVRYSCHCWSSKWDDDYSAGKIRIMDGRHERALDPERFNASLNLRHALIKALPEAQVQVYVTRSERNYGCYNTTHLGKEGIAYTAYFTMRDKRGRFNGIRYTLLLQVESAYLRVQPEEGRSKTSLRAIIAASRKGKVVRYRRP